MVWLGIGVVAVVLVGFIADGYRRPTNRPREVSSSPKAGRPASISIGRARVSRTASGGGLGVGLLALGGGLYLHSHYGPIAQVCQSGIGALGQALEPHTQTDCSLDSLLAEGGTILTIAGAAVVVLTVVLILAVVFDAHQQSGR